MMMKPPMVKCRACGTENEPAEGTCRRCRLSLDAIESDSSKHKITCPRCQQANSSDSFFCYACGKYFVDIEEAKTGRKSNRQRSRASLSPATKAKVLMPGGVEISLTGAPVFIERSDFDSTLPHDILMAVSRQHVLITYNRGKYYLQDYGNDGKGSTNHTKLNGVDIYHKRKRSLKDGDKIELAGQPELTMTFKLL